LDACARSTISSVDDLCRLTDENRRRIFTKVGIRKKIEKRLGSGTQGSQPTATGGTQGSQPAATGSASTASMFTAGQGAKYTLTKKLGQGSFGETFLAQKGDTMYAVKRTRTPNMDQANAFLREAMCMASCGHPFLVKLVEPYFDCVKDQIHVYIAMEYCDGGELFDHIIAGAEESGLSGLSEATCADVLRQTAGALRNAHARGVLRRR